MGRAKPRPRRQDLTDEELVQITLERFAPLRTGQALQPLKALTDRFGCDASTVTRAIQTAFKKGLVEISAVEKFEPERMAMLERGLLDTFERLRTAIVVNYPLDTANSEQARAGDELHESLGVALARYIATGSVFRDGDAIGCGSGRGVYHTVEALHRFPQMHVTDVTLVSLTGAMRPLHHSKPRNIPLDADQALGRFGSNFADQVTLRVMNHAIGYGDPGRLHDARDRSFLGDEKWTPPDLALMGVGTLSEGHRFYQAAQEVEGEPDYFLAPLLPDLKMLVQMCDEVVAKYGEDYCPVADICNRLFFVPPPGGGDQAVENDIKDKINAINARLLTATEAQIKQINTIILVAGTEKKARAIHRLLTDPTYNIRFLCTDRQTATRLAEWGNAARQGSSTAQTSR